MEVESVENLYEGLDLFKVAKIIKTEKHPNADRLKVCDVDVGEKELKKVVCGAPNAREGLITIYAPPGAVVPKNKVKLVVAKIRDVTSYGMLCSESELNYHRGFVRWVCVCTRRLNIGGGWGCYQDSRGGTGLCREP